MGFFTRVRSLFAKFDWLLAKHPAFASPSELVSDGDAYFLGFTMLGSLVLAIVAAFTVDYASAQSGQGLLRI
jgi:hypothetical protein